MADSNTKTYRGNCHCAAFVYEVDIPEFSSAGECNCSICSKKGVLWAYAPPEALRVVKGSEDALSTYKFGTGFAAHKFCPTCATPLMCVAPDAPPGRQLALNVRAMQHVDAWTLELTPLDGASFGTPYHPTPYTGPEPPASNLANPTIYHGSCHCGAVTLAIKTEPLNKDYPGYVLECACSICSINGYIWLYTARDQIVLQGEENLGKYGFGYGVLQKTFCKTCGVNITNQTLDLSDEEVKGLPEKAYKRWKFMSEWRPVNLRVLDGFDVEEIKTPEKLTHGVDFEPKYVYP